MNKKIKLIFLINIFGYLCLLLMILWFFSPYIISKIFTYTYQGRYFDLYSNNNLDSSLVSKLYKISNTKLDRTSAKINKKAKVLLINNNFIYAILTPMNYNGLATNNTFFNIIMVKKSSLENNLADNIFPLDALIVHEVVHGIVKENVTTSMRNIPIWINEGYPEHIAFYEIKNTNSLKSVYGTKKYLEYLNQYRKNINLENVNSLSEYLEKNIQN